MTTRVRLLLTPDRDLDTVPVRNRLKKHLETLRGRKLAEELIGDDDRSAELGVAGGEAVELFQPREDRLVDLRRRLGLGVNGGAKACHVAAQNQASVRVPSAMARALPG